MNDRSSPKFPQFLEMGLIGTAKGIAKKAVAKAIDRLMGAPKGVPPRPAPEPRHHPTKAAQVAPVSPPMPVSSMSRPEPPGPPPGPPPEPVGMLDLEEPPETYCVDEVAVLPRDPYTLFAYWEVTQDGRARAREALGGDGALVLRIFAVRAQVEGGLETTTHDIDLDWDHGRRYFGAPAPGAAVSGAVGLRAPDGRFAAIAQAPRVRVPYATPGPDGPVEWMEVIPARSRGARREKPEIVVRGPAQRIRGAATVGLPRWSGGRWEHTGASQVPLRPGQGGLPSAAEMPSSPWLWPGAPPAA